VQLDATRQHLKHNPATSSTQQQQRTAAAVHRRSAAGFTLVATTRCIAYAKSCSQERKQPRY
jgi:hypothetical protein